jgi:hypothetical protein
MSLGWHATDKLSVRAALDPGYNHCWIDNTLGLTAPELVACGTAECPSIVVYTVTMRVKVVSTNINAESLRISLQQVLAICAVS